MNTTGNKMDSTYDNLTFLNAAIDNTPLIDHHAHPLLKSKHMSSRPLLAITSEAHGEALNDSKTGLSHIAITNELSQVLGCEQTWDAVEAAVQHKRLASHKGWVTSCLEGVDAILLDDGLDMPGQAEDHIWHSKFTTSECKRIVRIETVASDIIAQLSNFPHDSPTRSTTEPNILSWFTVHFVLKIREVLLRSPDIVGFKSIVCYRRGLDIPRWDELNEKDVEMDLQKIIDAGVKPGTEFLGHNLNKRLEHTTLNYWIVHKVAQLIRNIPEASKPIQFHTGLGDNDITLTKSSPSHLQTFIREYPTVPIVLLHAGYPWTREMAYLAAMYSNVYADISEVFFCISRQGQESVLKQMLELCPWSKILCSTDGNTVPESYLVAQRQLRASMKTVLGEMVQRQHLNEAQAVELVQAILFSNAKKLYSLTSRSDLSTFTPSVPTQGGPITIPQAIEPTTRFGPVIQRLQQLNAKFLRVYFHDYTSSTRMRLIPINQVYRSLARGEPFTLSLSKVVFGLLQTDLLIPQINASGTYVFHPDWTTLFAGPVAGHVSCFGNFRNEEDGSAQVLCPRTLLAQTVSRAAEQGLTFLFGFEIEFIVLERTEEPVNNPTPREKYRMLTNDGHAAWMARSLADWGREGSFSTAVGEILEKLDEAGIPVDQFHAESAPGQYELVLSALPPLAACDNMLYARQILETVAGRHGFRVTLHPKPFPNVCGSASHIHLSISSPGGDNTSLYESFYAGVLSHMRAIIALAYSNPTSWARMLDSCWAGGRWVMWGTENKEAALRKIKHSHWEVKTVDGLANPYFVVAALIAAGIDGVQKKAKLAISDCALDPATLSAAQRKEFGIAEMLPADLPEALAALKEDTALAELLHPDFVQRYVDVKEAENDKILKYLSPGDLREWVLERY